MEGARSVDEDIVSQSVSSVAVGRQLRHYCASRPRARLVTGYVTCILCAVSEVASRALARPRPRPRRQQRPRPVGRSALNRCRRPRCGCRSPRPPDCRTRDISYSDYFALTNHDSIYIGAEQKGRTRWPSLGAVKSKNNRALKISLLGNESPSLQRLPFHPSFI